MSSIGPETEVIGTARGPLAVRRHGERTEGVPPLVVLHGGGPGCHAAADFGAVLPLLPSRETILVDLPGYGATPLHRPAEARFSGYADSLASLLDVLGVPVCDILAQSLGGIAAMTLSARRPGAVRRLVALGSQPLPAPRGVNVDPALGARARAAYYDGAPTAAGLREKVMALEWRDPSGIPDDLLSLRFAASITADALAVAAEPSLAGSAEDLADVPGQVDAATLVLWGEHDPFGEPAYGAWLAELLPYGSHAVIAGGAHHPQSELPEATAQLIGAHLDQEWT